MQNHDRKQQVQAESGQAIVILALVMVALIGFLGLVIDGGGLLFLQRDAQNATDAAVLAATYARCTGAPPADVIAAGYAAASANGFHNGINGQYVAVVNPPVVGEKAGDVNYIHVDITAPKPPFFIQVVYQGPLQVSTHAVGYCLPPFDPSDLPGIVGLSSTCTNTVRWAGSTGTIRGGVFSNGDAQFTGSDNVIEGGAQAVGSVDSPASNNNDFDPAPETGVDAIDDPLDGIFILGDYAPGGSVANAIQANGGLYHAIQNATDDADYHNGNHTWKPANGRTLEGLYYVDGDVDLGNSLHFAASPSGVSIVATGQIKGNAVNASYYPPANGILFWSNKTTNCGNDAIDMSGNSTQWHGLVFAPNGGISVSGSRLTLIGIVISQTVTMSASELLLVAEPDVIPPRPPLVRIAE